MRRFANKGYTTAVEPRSALPPTQAQQNTRPAAPTSLAAVRHISVAALIAPLLGSFGSTSILWLDIFLPPVLLALSLLLYDVERPIAPRLPREEDDKPDSGPEDGDAGSQQGHVKGPMAHIYINSTSHARFLPKESQHAFTYPVLQFGFDLDALEQGSLDLPWLFRYLGENPSDEELDGGAERKEVAGVKDEMTRSWLRPWAWSPHRTICSLSPDAYLRPSLTATSTSTQPTSLKARLLMELALRYGVDTSDIGRCYLVTMPRFLGYEGINPLSAWFCYRADEPVSGALKVVVLEVHNTFGERSLYLLQPGIDEEPKPQSGYQHQWLIPRSFHVSPFNDRSGFYRICLNDPFSPAIASPSSPPHSAAPSTHNSRPRFKLKIILLTSPDLSKKLYASLAGEGVPLTSRALVSALARYPLELFLPMPRILWQASKLHFLKRLDVFPRPEPLMLLDDDGGEEAGAACLEALNPVESGARVGGVGWQNGGWTTEVAKKAVIAFLQARIRQLAEEAFDAASVNDEEASVASSDDVSSLPSYSSSTPPSLVSVRLVPGDTNQPVMTFDPPETTAAARGLLVHRTLTIHYLTPLFFNDLVSFPSPHWALTVASKVEKRWVVDEEELFLTVFDTPPASADVAKPRTGRLGVRAFARRKAGEVAGSCSQWALTKMRTSQARWHMSFAASSPPRTTSTAKSEHLFDAQNALPVLEGTASNPLDWAPGQDDLSSTTWRAAAMGWGFAMERATYHAFRLMGARFVPGTEPWGQWARAIDQASGEGRTRWGPVGSVLRKP